MERAEERSSAGAVRLPEVRGVQGLVRGVREEDNEDEGEKEMSEKMMDHFAFILLMLAGTVFGCFAEAILRAMGY